MERSIFMRMVCLKYGKKPRGEILSMVYFPRCSFGYKRWDGGYCLTVFLKVYYDRRGVRIFVQRTDNSVELIYKLTKHFVC